MAGVDGGKAGFDHCQIDLDAVGVEPTDGAAVTIPIDEVQGDRAGADQPFHALGRPLSPRRLIALRGVDAVNEVMRGTR